MVTEIELKAHVRDSGGLRRRLTEIAEYLGSFEKNDAYWFSDEDNNSGTQRKGRGFPPSTLRVRAESRVLSDGREESATYATFKTKEVRDGIEINDEREFEVRPSPGHDGKDFEEFLRRIGFKPGAAKRKRGWTFSRHGITAELLEVDTLGWFIELEIVTDKNREEILVEGKKRLLDFLDTLGIGKENIESRFYSELLR